MPLKQRKSLIRLALQELRAQGWELDEAVFQARLSLRQTTVEDSYEMQTRRSAVKFAIAQAKRLGMAA